MRLVTRRALWLAPIVAAGLAGCAGSVGYQPVSLVPTASTATVTALEARTSGGTLVALPPTTEVPGGGIAFPTTTGGTPAISVTVQPSVPASLPAPGGSPLMAYANRSVSTLGSPATVAVIVVQLSQTLTFPSAPAFTVTLPGGSMSASATYELAYYDPVAAQWNGTWAGPASTSGSTLTFASNGLPWMFAARTPQTFAVLSFGGAPSLSPSPLATPTPTAAATPTPIPKNY